MVHELRVAKKVETLSPVTLSVHVGEAGEKGISVREMARGSLCG